MSRDGHNLKNPGNIERSVVDQGHELDVFWARMVTSLGIGLLLLVILALIGIAVAFYVFLPNAMSTHAGTIWLEQNLDPGVDPNQAYQREQLLAEEEAFLRQYSWEDKERGIARIPIERGIELMAQRKLNAAWSPEVVAWSTEKSSSEESSSEEPQPEEPTP